MLQQVKTVIAALTYVKNTFLLTNAGSGILIDIIADACDMLHADKIGWFLLVTK